MTSEEMIQNGVTPVTPGTTGVVDVVDPPADPGVLSDVEKLELEAEALYDWERLSSAQLKFKRAQDRNYAEALERCASEGYVQTPYEASIGPDGNYKFDLRRGAQDPADAAPVVIAPATEPPPPPPAPVPSDISDPDDPFVKTADGWEVVIDLKDGGGIQRFKGRTKTELSKKLVKAQVNATKEIRRRNREAEVINDFDVNQAEFEKVQVGPTFTPITPDEQYSLTSELADPATSRKAFRRLLQAEASDPTTEIGSRLRKADEVLAYNDAKEVAKNWVQLNPAFYNDPSGENIRTLYRFFVKHTVAVTTKNMDTVFNVLRAKGALLEAPVQELEPEPPAILPIAAPAPSAATPVAVAAVPPSSPAPAAQPGRTRPGSVTTGMSPRQASVRPGVNTATPVGLTVEEYHKTPAGDVRRRYNSDPVFRQGVDKLISEGKI